MDKIDFLNSIDKIGIELKQAEEFGHSEDIYWFSNNIEKGVDVQFNNGEITEYYKTDDYGKVTRWDLWTECVSYLSNEMKCESLLDIGGANGHFSFLCLNNNIESYTIEPRIDMVRSTEQEFTRHFGSKKNYCGNLKTFLNVIKENEDEIEFKFGCVSILNFLHGKNHDINDIIGLVNYLPKITDYILVSDPDWRDLNTSNLFKDYQHIKSFGHDKIHKLYKITK